MDVIESCRSSRIYELKFLATVEDAQSYLCPGK